MTKIYMTLIMALIASPALAEDTTGANYKFSLGDATGTKSAISVNPDGPGNGVSYTFDSGNTLNADGSMTYRFGGDGNSGIVVRTEPLYDD